MDDRLKGQPPALFFLGYVVAGPRWLSGRRWSPEKLISIFSRVLGHLCGRLWSGFQFSGIRRDALSARRGRKRAVYPTMLVLLANWFPRSERARANAYWNLCQPLAVAASAGHRWLLGAGRQTMLMIEGACHSSGCRSGFISSTTVRAMRNGFKRGKGLSGSHLAARSFGTGARKKNSCRARPFCARWFSSCLAVCFLYNFASYGCNTFPHGRTQGGGHNFTGLQTGLLFAVPYVVTAIVMVLLSRFGPDRRTPRPRRPSFMPSAHIPHRERFDQGTFLLAFVCVPVSGHTGSVRRAGAVLCHSHGDDAAPRRPARSWAW